MIKRELHMSHIRPFIGNDLIKILTGIRGLIFDASCSHRNSIDSLKKFVYNIFRFIRGGKRYAKY